MRNDLIRLVEVKKYGSFFFTWKKSFKNIRLV